MLATLFRTPHQLCNIFIEVDVGATVAYTEAYFTAHHRLRPKGDPLASPTAYDTEMDVWVGGAATWTGWKSAPMSGRSPTAPA